MKKELEVSEELKLVAQEVIKKNDIFYSVQEPNIAYLMVSPYISKTVAGRCSKANEKLKFFTDFDYVIEISEMAWNSITEESRIALMHHELLHVLVTQNESNGSWNYRIADHDLKDFKAIISKYGNEWYKPIIKEMADKLELTAEEIDSFQI